MAPPPRPIDDLARPRLPAILRVLNSAAGPFARRLARLDEEGLLEAARRATGLDDFGDDSFREPLRVLLASLEREAELSALGRLSTRRLLVQLLANRLRVEDLIRRHPEILDERVERPIVIAGLPRTGTTHLLNCLARHPDLRTLPYWESLEPVLPEAQRPGPGEPDPRLRRCARALAFLERVLPLFPAMHELSVEGPHEEIQLLAMHFSTQLFEASYRVPAYAEWYRTTDQTQAYAYLRRVLQALQWLRGPRRWALKSPQHLENLGALAATFPDARFIQTHRDPVRVAASLGSMIAYAQRMQMRADAVDPVATGRHWARRLEQMLRASVEGRRHLPADQVLDVRFHAFMKDPWATLERVFAFAGQPLSGRAAAAIRAHLEESPRGKHGAILYRLEDLGLDERELREKLRFYQERFDVPSEE